MSSIISPYNNRQQYEKRSKRPDYIIKFIQFKFIMTQETQPLIYHSLSRHVQSISSQADHLKVFNIYSSNQQPPIPSILERSRTKKSHQKSLKKGLSRVSKSKTTINIEQGLRKQEDQRQLSKGTLLNFNIQEVIEKKYDITKPRDQILQISPRKGQATSMKQLQTSQPGSNQKSFISEYRIVTYVPSGRQQDDRRQSFVREEKESMRNESGVQENWDKQNNSNHSNVFRNNYHNKNDSQSIQIINPQQENILQQNTWRTSDNNFDPYYSNNFNKQLNLTNEPVRQTTQRQQLYSSLKPKYSVPVSNEVSELRGAIMEVGALKDKIKHLQHEIVEIEREKSSLVKDISEQVRELDGVTEQNDRLKMDKRSLEEQNESLKEDNVSLREKIAILSQQTNLSKEKKFSQSYLFEETDKKLQPKSKSIEQTLRKQILSLQEGNETLSLCKAKLQKELSEKTLLITQLNRKNKDLLEKISDFERDLRKEKQKIQSQEEKLYRKDQKINSLSLQVDRLNLLTKQLKQKQSEASVTNNKSTLVEPKQFRSLAMDRSREERTQNLLKEELDKVKHEYEQLQRDYVHLEKKNMFMKDELEHLKYLQLNASSSALSHRYNTQNNYNSLNANNYNTTTNANLTNNITKEKQLQHSIYELETRLQISERNLRQVQEEYSNLKQNFRALEELYIKQQDQSYELQQQAQKLTQDNNKLKIQLVNLQQISKAKTIAFADNESLKLMEKQQQLLRLKKEFSNLQRKYSELQRKYIEIEKNQIQTKRKFSQTQRRQLQSETQIKILQTELKALKKETDQSYNKYLSELEKNSQLTQRHKEDLDIYITKMEKEQQQKITIVADKYQKLIAKLNEEIQSQKSQITALKETHLSQMQFKQDEYIKQLQLNQQAHLDQLTHIQNQHKQEIQTLLSQIDRQQLNHKSQLQKYIAETKQCQKCKQNQSNNTLVQSKNDTKRFNSENRFQTATKMSRFLNYESMSRKQLQSFTTELQSDFTLVENKYKTLVIEKQRLEDHLEATSRQLIHLEQQIRLYKQQKQNSLKEKYELRQQVQRTNLMMLEMKKAVSLFDQQKASFNSRINQLNKKYFSTVQEYEQLIKELKEVKTLLYDKEIVLQNYQHDIRELRINLLEEKEISEKKIREICVLKDQKQAIKSKEEYYKMLFDKTQKQLQTQLYQKGLFLTTHAPKVLTSSPIKHSPQKGPSSTKPFEVSPKTRQTQLYRIQIFKDLNKLLDLTNEHFTLQQIIQKNQQQYLRMLYNAVKQDHSKVIELKQLIVDMEEGFRKEKVFIKEDYDVLYEKYLKYKNMCQDMNRDIQKYKLKLKAGRDVNFVNIDV